MRLTLHRNRLTHEVAILYKGKMRKLADSTVFHPEPDMFQPCSSSDLTNAQLIQYGFFLVHLLENTLDELEEARRERLRNL